jgi:hypothetical protein
MDYRGRAHAGELRDETPSRRATRLKVRPKANTSSVRVTGFSASGSGPVAEGLWVTQAAVPEPSTVLVVTTRGTVEVTRLGPAGPTGGSCGRVPTESDLQELQDGPGREGVWDIQDTHNG